MKLDEQVYAFYRPTIEKKGFCPPILDVKVMRAASDMTFNDKKEIIPIRSSRDVRIPSPDAGSGESLRLRIFTPYEGNQFPVLLYFHGGGFIMHNIESHDALCRKLALTLGFVVVSVGYRLAPEHPYPAAVEDAEAAYRWVRESAPAQGWNANKIYAAGDSAGATLSAALVLKLAGNATEPGTQEGRLAEPALAQGARPAGSGTPAQNAAESALAGLLLLYGVYGAADLSTCESGRLFSGGDYVLPKEMLDFCDRLYVGNADRNDPLLYPGNAKDFRCFPPCVIVAADFDPLRDDSYAFADLLENAGVPVTRVRAAGMMHGFALHWHRFRRAEEILLKACSALVG